MFAPIYLILYVIFQRILGLDLSRQLLAGDFSMVNKGALAEQFVGLEIVKYSSVNSKQKLFYWHREKPGSNAEVDYIIQKKNKIVPIEVKSGTQGKMQSLHIFLKEKDIGTGIRISSENFCSYEILMFIHFMQLLSCCNETHSTSRFKPLSSLCAVTDAMGPLVFMKGKGMFTLISNKKGD